MPKSSQFKIASINFSLFTPGLTFSPNKILAEMLPEFKKIFDGDIMTLPVPLDAPLDIPRLIMSSQDNKFKLEISPSRINIFRYTRSPEDEVYILGLVEQAENITKAYLAITNAKVGRMAVVVVRYFEEARPGIELSSHFCRDKWLDKQPLNRPENFEIHAHKRYVLSEHQVNSWVRCKTGKLSMPNQDQKKVILVEQDINTLAEDMDKKEYSMNDIVGFWNTVTKELDFVLNLYFPNAQNG